MVNLSGLLFIVYIASDSFYVYRSFFFSFFNIILLLILYRAYFLNVILCTIKEISLVPLFISFWLKCTPVQSSYYI